MDPSSAVLSDYEKLRLEKIQRNQKRLKELGLDQPLLPKARVVRKAKQSIQVAGRGQEATRRSTRKRRMLDYSDDGPNEEDHEEDEENKDWNANDDASSVFSDSDNLSEDESEEVASLISEPVKKKARPAFKKEVDVQVDITGGLTCELAKTGRSTCRKCGTKIEKGAPRVGMKAWIVGRQAITWQCPQCLLGNLTCSYDSSGRTKCKTTGKQISKGELKIGVRSHTATSFYKVEAIGGLLGVVLKWVAKAEQKEALELLEVDGMEGSDRLTQEDRDRIQSILSSLKSTKVSTDVEDGKDSTKNQRPTVRGEKAKKNPTTTKKEQPKLGSKTGAKGRVEWKFGAHICYGTLIPGKETKTHCFARTHKGNVKTLAKGKDYWSMIVE